MKTIPYLLEKTNPLIVFGIVWISLILLFGIPTALIPNPIIPYVRMIPPTHLDYAFLFIVGGLLAFYVSFSTTPKTNLPVGVASVAGFISFACPICNYLLVAALGFPFVLSVIEPLRPVLGIVSIALFLLFLYFQWSKKCMRFPFTRFFKSKKTMNMVQENNGGLE